jgi:hypothetical protein
MAINGDRWRVRNADNQTTTLTAADESRLEKKKFAEDRGWSEDDIRVSHHPTCRPPADADRDSGRGYAET